MAQWGAAIFIAGLLLTVFAMLYPFQFDLRFRIPFAERLAGRFDARLFKSDFIANVLLFLPLGFGASSLLHQRRLVRIASLVVVLGFGVGVSIIGEVLQLWYPGRSSSLSDILANGIGVLMGYVYYRRLGAKVLRQLAIFVPKVKAQLTFRVLLAVFGTYMLVILLISISLQRGPALGNWDRTYPLILGNELTGDRAWRGCISEMHFADSAITESHVASIFSASDPIAVMGNALVASYRFTDGGSYHDRMGHLSELSWKGTAPNAVDERGIAFTSDHWLVSEEPAAYLSDRLNATSEFTLITTVATAAPEQWGPARIVSISQDPTYRNFTLGQGGRDLVLRLRTRMGPNASRPALVVPDIFGDTDSHRLIISYDSGAFRIYVDGLAASYSVTLTPEVTFFHSLLGTMWWSLRLNSASVGIYTLLYYGFFIFPAGLLLALASNRDPRRGRLSSPWIWGGILLPCMALEIILAASRGLRLQNLLLSVVSMGAAALLFRVLTAHFFEIEFSREFGREPA